MAQIITSQIQACPTVSPDAESQHGELYLAFEQEAEQWHKRNDRDENVDSAAAVGVVMMSEKTLPPLAPKAEIGRVGEDRIEREIVTPQLLMLPAVAVIHPDIFGKIFPAKKVLLPHEAVLNTVSHGKSHVLTAAPIFPTKVAPKVGTAMSEMKAVSMAVTAMPVSKSALALTVPEATPKAMSLIAATALTAKVAPTLAAAVMATASKEGLTPTVVTLSKAAPAAAFVSIESEEAQTRSLVVAELTGHKPAHKPAPKQELTLSAMNAPTLPLIDVRSAPVVHTHSEQQPSPHPIAQLLTSRKTSESEVPKGSEMTFRFSKWGEGHTVKVQSTSSGYASQLTLRPSDALVAHRLSEHLSISAPADHWTLLKDDEERSRRQQPGQLRNEEEST